MQQDKGDATIQRVAKHARVAPSTVSTFIHHPDRVGAAVSERIRLAMGDLNYRPNPYARALRTGTLHVYAVLSSPPHVEIVGVFLDPAAAESVAAKNHGHTVFTVLVQ